MHHLRVGGLVGLPLLLLLLLLVAFCLLLLLETRGLSGFSGLVWWAVPLEHGGQPYRGGARRKYKWLLPHCWPGVGRWSHVLEQNLFEANVPAPGT